MLSYCPSFNSNDWSAVSALIFIRLKWIPTIPQLVAKEAWFVSFTTFFFFELFWQQLLLFSFLNSKRLWFLSLSPLLTTWSLQIGEETEVETTGNIRVFIGAVTFKKQHLRWCVYSNRCQLTVCMRTSNTLNSCHAKVKCHYTPEKLGYYGITSTTASFC